MEEEELLPPPPKKVENKAENNTEDELLPPPPKKKESTTPTVKTFAQSYGDLNLPSGTKQTVTPSPLKPSGSTSKSEGGKINLFKGSGATLPSDATTKTTEVMEYQKPRKEVLQEKLSLMQERNANTRNRLSEKKALMQSEASITEMQKAAEQELLVLQNVAKDQTRPIQERQKAQSDANAIISDINGRMTEYESRVRSYNELVAKDKQYVSDLIKKEKQLKTFTTDEEYSTFQNFVEKIGKNTVEAGAGIADMMNTIGLFGMDFSKGSQDYAANQEYKKQNIRENIQKVRDFGESLVTQTKPEDYQSLFKGNFSAGKLLDFSLEAVSSTVPTVAAGFLTGGTGAMATGAGMMFGESKEILKSTGLTDEEAEWGALGLALPLGAFEKWGLDDAIKAFRKSGVLQKAATEYAKKVAGKNLTKQMLFETAKETLGQAIKTEAPIIATTGLKETVTEMSQGEVNEIAKQIAQEITGKDEDEGMPTFEYVKEQLLARAEEGAGGFVGGVGIQTVGSVLGRARTNPIVPTAYQQAVEYKAPEQMQEFQTELQADVEAGLITPEQATEAINNVVAIQTVDTMIPPTVTDLDARTQAVNLIMEKQALTAEVEGKDESMIAPQKERLAEIDGLLTEISKTNTEVDDIDPFIQELEKLKEDETKTTEEAKTSILDSETPQTADIGGAETETGVVQGDALKDIESTAKALEGVDRDMAHNLTNWTLEKSKRLKELQDKEDNETISKSEKVEFDVLMDEFDLVNEDKLDEANIKALGFLADVPHSKNTPKAISEAYHKAKADGSNPELVKAVEELLGQKVSPSVQAGSLVGGDVVEPKGYADATDAYKATELGSSEDAKNKKQALVEQAETEEGKKFVESEVSKLEKNDDGTITVFRSGTLQEGHNPATTSRKMAETIASERKKQGLSSDIIEVRVNPSDISVVVKGIESEVFVKVDKTNKERLDKNTLQKQKTKSELLAEKDEVQKELDKTIKALADSEKAFNDGTYPFSENVFNDSNKKQKLKIKNLEWQLSKIEQSLKETPTKQELATQEKGEKTNERKEERKNQGQVLNAPPTKGEVGGEGDVTTPKGTPPTKPNQKEIEEAQSEIAELDKKLKKGEITKTLHKQLVKVQKEVIRKAKGKPPVKYNVGNLSPRGRALNKVAILERKIDSEAVEKEDGMMLNLIGFLDEESFDIQNNIKPDQRAYLKKQGIFAEKGQGKTLEQIAENYLGATDESISDMAAYALLELNSFDLSSFIESMEIKYDMNEQQRRYDEEAAEAEKQVKELEEAQRAAFYEEADVAFEQIEDTISGMTDEQIEAMYDTLLEQDLETLNNLYNEQQENDNRAEAGQVKNDSQKDEGEGDSGQDEKGTYIDPKDGFLKDEDGNIIFEPKIEYENEATTKEGQKIPFTSQASTGVIASEPNISEQGSEAYNPSPDIKSITWVERTIERTKRFDFTGPNKIKSAADVAFLFRHLESAVSENVFAVLIDKNGKYKVVYISTGATTASLVDMKPIISAATEFKADSVVLVHNHPSGRLEPSQADKILHSKLNTSMAGIGVRLHDSVIINLDTGKFVEFTNIETSVSERKTEADYKEKLTKPKVYEFSKQVLYDYSWKKSRITSSRDAAEFVSRQKRGAVPKMGVIVLDRANNINRYILIDPNLTANQLTKIVLQEVAKHGESVILSTNNPVEKSTIDTLKLGLSSADMTLLDIVVTQQDPSITSAYESYADEGKLNEQQDVYGTQPQLKKAVAEAKSALTSAESQLSKARKSYEKALAESQIDLMGNAKQDALLFKSNLPALNRKVKEFADKRDEAKALLEKAQAALDNFVPDNQVQMDLPSKIRDLKIDGKNKLYDATIGIPVALYNTGVEMVAKAVEGGIALRKAIESAVKYIDEQMKGKQWNRGMFYKDMNIRYSVTFPNGKKVEVEKDTTKETAEVINGWYSPIEQKLLDAKVDKTTGKEWIKKLGGGEEMQWNGLENYLNENANNSLTKADIQQYLKDNRVSVVEVVKSDKTTKEQYNEDAIKRGNKVGLEVEFGSENEIEITLPGEGTLLSDEVDTKEHREFTAKNYNVDISVLEVANDLFNENKSKRYRSSNEEQVFNTKFSQYQLEGEKENYKEIMVILPRTGSMAKVGDYKVPVAHRYGEDLSDNRRLVHLRMNTRTDAEGNKVLFLEEVQSDWGQLGKKEGFSNKMSKKTVIPIDVRENENGFFTVYERGTNNILADNYFTEQAARDHYESPPKHIGVPEAPFVMDTNAWTKLGLKVALKEAVAQGVDKIAWTTGEQQNDRYDLSKQIEKISYDKSDNTITAWNKDGKQVIQQTAKESELPNIIGKDVADKLLNQKEDEEGVVELSGQDIKVGGKGMKGFYGSPTEGSLGIVGNVAKSLFKQEPKTISVKGASDISGVEDYGKDSKGYFVKIGGNEKSYFNNKAEYDNWAKEANIITQHSIDVTPELKESVKAGLPLFNTDSIIKALDNLKIDTKGTLNAFGIIPAAWNATIDTVKAAYIATKNIAEAIEKGLEYARKWAKENNAKFDEAGAKQSLEKAFKQQTKQPAGGLASVTSKTPADLKRQAQAIADAKLEYFKEIKDALKRIGVNIAEGYLSKRNYGVYKYNPKKIRVQSLWKIGTVTHEVAHWVSDTFDIGKTLRSKTAVDPSNPNSTTNKKLRKELTRIYVEFYPDARPEHSLRLRVEEGIAVLLQQYFYNPTDIGSRYPSLVKEFITPGGLYYNDKFTQTLGEMNGIMDKYSGLLPQEQLGARIARGKELLKNDKLKFTWGQKLDYELFKSDEILKIIDDIAGSSMTNSSAEIAHRRWQTRGHIASNWVRGQQAAMTIDKNGNWKPLKYSMKDMAKEIQGKEKEFDEYLVARRALGDINRLTELENELANKLQNFDPATATKEEIEAIGQLQKNIQSQKSIIANDDFDIQNATDVVNMFEKQFEKATEIFDYMNNATAEFAYHTGLISGEQLSNYQSNPTYAAFRRLVHDDMGTGDPSLGGSSQKSKITATKSRTGSTKQIISPVYSQMFHITETINKGMQNQIWKKLAEIAQSDSFVADNYFEKVETQVAVDEKTGKISYPQITDKNLVPVWKNGKPTFYIASKELLAMAEIMKPQELHMALFFARRAAGTFARLTTSANVLFPLVNMPVDTMSAWMNTKTGFKPVVSQIKTIPGMLEYMMDYIGMAEKFSDFWNKIRNKPINTLPAADIKMFEKYLALGGSTQTLAGYLQMTPDEVMKAIRNESNVVKATKWIEDHTLGLLELPSNISEYMTRFAEFKRAKEQGKSDDVAMWMASEVSVPFIQQGNLGGRFGREYVRSIPYFNASLQVLGKLIREAKDNPARVALVTGAILSIQIGLAIATVMDSDDEDLQMLADQTPEQLSKFLYIPKAMYGKKGYMTMRVPEQIGWMGATALMAMLELKKVKGYSFKDYVSAATSGIPQQFKVWEPDKALMSYAPQIVRPSMEVITNTKTFPNIGPIVPYGLSTKLPEYQYTQYTSEVAKMIGKQLNASPMLVDHFMKAQFGKVPAMVIDVTESYVFDKKMKYAKLPINLQAEEFVLRGTEINKFYENLQYWNKVNRSLKDKQESGDYSEEDLMNLKTSYNIYEGVNTIVGNFRDVLNNDIEIPFEYRDKLHRTMQLLNDDLEPYKHIDAVQDLFNEVNPWLTEQRQKMNKKKQTK